MPRWLNRPLACGGHLREVEEVLAGEGLNTVCVSAKCPNRGRCFSSGTATFMIMGEICTRNCSFCGVEHGVPQSLMRDEPEAIARAAAKLGVSYVVITSVTRDDLPDGGATHFAKVVEAVRELMPEAIAEVLVPDFKGDASAIETVLRAKPNVLSHNVETVPRLYPSVRPGADYQRSLEVLSRASSSGILVKSGFMVGLGETRKEILSLLCDLKSSGCDFVTIGQYLRPGKDNIPVERYVHPEEFRDIEEAGFSMGFSTVKAAPFVRSSYLALEMYNSAVGF